jgi:drug/metabolite transporter (DMT)-like permease
MDDAARGKAASVIQRGRIKAWVHGKFAPLRGRCRTLQPGSAALSACGGRRLSQTRWSATDMRQPHWSQRVIRASSCRQNRFGNFFMAWVRETGTRRVGGWLFDQPYLLLALTSLFWAGNTILGRFIAGHVPPITLAFIRWAGACLILLPFAAPHLRRDWPVIRRHAGIMALLAFTGFSVYNTLSYYGLQYTTAINGLLLQSVAPLFVAMWTFALFGDRLTWRQAGGICISLTGVVVIVCHGSLAVLLDIAFNRGDVAFLIALVVYGFYAAFLRRRPDMHPFSFLAAGMGGGAVLLIPAVIWEISIGRTMVFDAESVASFAFICIFPSLLGYLFLNRGIELIGANRAAPFIHLVPVFGSAMAVALLHERFELFHAVGYALVFAGITVAARK